jgi:cell division protein FtsQ
MIEQKRMRVYRTSGVFIAIVLLVATAGAVWFAFNKAEEVFFSQNPRYAIKTLDIRSDGRVVTPGLVRGWTGLRAGMNLFMVDVNRTRRLLQKVPMVKSVTITRRLPDTLEIRLSERSPIARIKRRDASFLGVDRDGCFFSLTATGQTLPIIMGYYGTAIEPGNCMKGQAVKALEVMDVCSRTSVGKAISVAFIDVSSEDCLRVYLAGGECARLPWSTPEQPLQPYRQLVERKLRQLTQGLQNSANRGKRIAWIDLTFSDEYIPAKEY